MAPAKAMITELKIDVQDLSPVKRRMTVEVPPAEVERERAEVLRGYQKKVRLPGFRPGRVPLEMIRARFAEEIEQELREHVVAHYFHAAARERGIRPVGDPQVEDLAHEEQRGLSFRTTFEVLPRIEVRSFEGIEVRRPSCAVDDAEVDQALEQLRRSRARLVVKGEGGAAPGDVLIADVEAYPAGAEPVRRERVPIEIGGGDNPPEFDARLAGARPGDDLAFGVDYPPEHRTPALAGKRVEFRLHVYELKRPETPALDDEFARDLGPFDDLAALRARARADLEARKGHEAERQVRQSLLDKLLLANPIVLPDALVEREVRQRLEDFVRGLIARGIDPERAEIDWVELRARQETPARKTVHAGLVLDALAESRQLRVDPAEVDQRIAQDATALGQTAQELRRQLVERRALDAVAHQILREKTLDYLSSVANIQSSERGSA